MEIVETRLLQRFNEGDEQAFQEVSEQYCHRLRYYASKFIGGTETRKAVVAAFTHLAEQLQAERKFASLDDIGDLLFLETFNAVCTQGKITQWQSRYMEDDIKNFRIETELLQQLFDAIKKLPPAEKDIFMQWCLEKRSCREIADELNLSLQEVRIKKSHALLLVRKQLLTDYYPHE